MSVVQVNPRLGGGGVNPLRMEKLYEGDFILEAGKGNRSGNITNDMISAEMLSDYDMVFVKLDGTITGHKLSTSTSKTYNWYVGFCGTGVPSGSGNIPRDISGSGEGERTIHLVKTLHAYLPNGWWGQAGITSTTGGAVVSANPLVVDVRSDTDEQISMELHVTIFGMKFG